MKNNDLYAYLDDNMLADMGFHLPTHRIIKIPYRGYRKRGGGIVLGIGLGIIGIGIGISLSLKVLSFPYSKSSEKTKNYEVTHIKLNDSKSLDERVSLELPKDYLIDMPIYKPSVRIGLNTESTIPFTDSQVDRIPTTLKDLINSGNSQVTFLRLVSNDKDPVKLYAHTANKGDLNQISYDDLFFALFDAHFHIYNSDQIANLSSPHFHDFTGQKNVLFTKYAFDQDGKFRVTNTQLFPEFIGRTEFLNQARDFTNYFSGKTRNKFFPLSVAGINGTHKKTIELWYSF